MDSAFNKYPNSAVIHLDQTTKTGKCVTKTRFLDMLSRELAYRASHNGLRPPGVWTIRPTVNPTVIKPVLIRTLETTLGGSIGNLTDFINLLRKVGVYFHYNCVSYPNPSVSIPRIRKGGLNCADYVYLTIQVIKAFATMGIHYTYEIGHVDCNSADGKPDKNAGHFLLLKVLGFELTHEETVDPAEATSGRLGIGSNMCMYNFNGTVGNTLCFN
jgi:hypothetical protein